MGWTDQYHGEKTGPIRLIHRDHWDYGTRGGAIYIVDSKRHRKSIALHVKSGHANIELVQAHKARSEPAPVHDDLRLSISGISEKHLDLRSDGQRITWR